MNELTINEFSKYDVNNMECDSIKDLGWKEWSCPDTSLEYRSKKFITLAKDISNNYGQYKFFLKNNCPYDGELYDNMTIKNDSDEDVILIEYRDTEWSIFDVMSDDWSSLFCGTKSEMIKWLNDNYSIFVK